MLRALAYFTPSRPETRHPQDDQTNRLKDEVPHITPGDSPQLVMGVPDIRTDEDDETFSQPEPKEQPVDNDQVKASSSNTIHTEPDEDRKGQSEVPQSEENKDRFMRGENESTQKRSSSAGESDSGSGANILPPDNIKEQAEKEEESNFKELFMMIKNQQDSVNDFQKRQEEMQLQQQDLIIATVKKSMESETKATHRLIQDQKEEIMTMFHSASKKID